MHVAFGRVRRKSRIVADDTDCRGFGGTWRTVKLQVNRCRRSCMTMRARSELLGNSVGRET